MNFLKRTWENPTVRRYVASSVQTFLTIFFITLALSFQDMNFDSFTAATFLGMLSIAVRAGIKAVWESFLVKR